MRRRVAVGIPLLEERVEVGKLSYLMQRLDEILRRQFSLVPFFLLPKEGARELETPYTIVEEGFAGFVKKAVEEKADLLVIDPGFVEADLEVVLAEVTEGLLLPLLEGEASLCLGVIPGSGGGDLLDQLLLRPLFVSLFSARVEQVLPTTFAASQDLMLGFFDHKVLGSFATPFQLLLEASCTNKRILQVPLSFRPALNLWQPAVVRKVIKTAFSEISRRESIWKERLELPLETPPLLRPKARIEGKDLYIFQEDERPFLRRYLKGLSIFSSLFTFVIPRVHERLISVLAKKEPIRLKGDLWAEAVYGLFGALRDPRPFSLGDLYNALTVLFYGRAFTFLHELRDFTKEERKPLDSGLAFLQSERLRDELAFLACLKESFNSWQKRARLPRVTYREYVPGIPLLFPHRANGVSLEEVFKELLEERREAFWSFARESLGVKEGTPAQKVLSLFRTLLYTAEEELRNALRGDPRHKEGLRELLEALIPLLRPSGTFTLGEKACSWFLDRFPPKRALRFSPLLRLESPRELLAFARAIESSPYWEGLKHHMLQDLRPDLFELQDLKVVPLAWPGPLRSSIWELELADKLCGVLFLRALSLDLKPEFPWLTYVLLTTKKLVELESYGELWDWASRSRKEFGRAVVEALEGHWGRDPLSAYSVFEASVHEKTLQRLKGFAEGLCLSAFRKLLEGYKLCFQFPEGRFVTFSAWSWVVYSLSGGKGNPGPLASEVEAQLFAKDFLSRVLSRVGVPYESLRKAIREMQLEGREAQSLIEELFPQTSRFEVLKPKGPVFIKGPVAKRLKRYEGNPILRPVKEHGWESRFVFNPAAIRLKGKIYLLYRAMGEDMVSRIGLAVLDQTGKRVIERLTEPIFWPVEDWEELGCEDPRLVLLEGRLWMLYTAYSRAVAQIALASIDPEDFLLGRWEKWQRHGLLFPGESNKDAFLFPERIDGKFVLVHRVEPAMWISFSKVISCPWPSMEHSILMGPRSGDMWDSLKIGAGAPPLKTRYGWLLIYHGVDRRSIYRLGSLLLDIEDPKWILYRSPNPILEPLEPYEKGETGCQVPNVVFTCGAVPQEETEILSFEDEVLIYYGAADTVIALATGKVGDMVPWPIGIERWWG